MGKETVILYYTAGSGSTFVCCADNFLKSQNLALAPAGDIIFFKKLEHMIVSSDRFSYFPQSNSFTDGRK